MPEKIYRLSCFRYLFLIYLGYIWATNRITRTLTKGQIILVSLMILLVLYYSTGSLKPFLHDTPWRTFHWVCYFYTAFLLPWVIWKVYDRVPDRIRLFIEEIGKWSYEIFLVQMVVFTLYPYSLLSFGNWYIDTVVFIVLSMAVSIIPVLLWKRYKHALSFSSNKAG